jgi:hypothetical protein
MKRALLLIPLLIGTLLLPGCSDQSALDDSATPAWETWADAASFANDDWYPWVDTKYRYSNADPAYEEGGGPHVYIDEAHFNYHTAEGIFRPFAELLRGDGYRVTRFRSRFTAEALADCQILVIANAQARANTIGFGSPESNWAYPHASALTREEIDEVILWIRGGGALFLIADHAPLPAAVRDLALLLGVHMLDGYAFASAEEMTGKQTGDIVFGTLREEQWREAEEDLRELVDLDFNTRYEPVLANPGDLAPHPVVEGLNPRERIEWIVTFTGQAFIASDDWKPIMVFGPNAVTVAPLAFNFEDAEYWDGPLFSVAGWLHGATRKLDQGRVAILGEGGMCTAQHDDLDGEIDGPLVPYGINAPQAPYNAQFCLNVMHWLSGLLDE